MPQRLIEQIRRDYPWAIPPIILLIHAVKNMPKPGRKWTRSTIYAWFYATATGFVAAVEQVIEATRGLITGKK